MISEPALDRWAQRALRIALGAAFLSAVSGRFGLWNGTPWTTAFDRFLDRTAHLNAFMPAWTIPFLAWGATIAESTLGVALIAGVLRYWTALGAAILLAIFGTEMAVFDGIKSPLDYSVFSASAGRCCSRAELADGRQAPHTRHSANPPVAHRHSNPRA